MVNIARLRTLSQQVARQNLRTPGELVAWFGAVQAQDYPASKWAIASRLSTLLSDADIEKAVNDKQIVRTWPMRGTLHFVQPQDVHWMLELLAHRVENKFRRVQEDAGLDLAHFDKAADILAVEMRGEQLTRKDVHDILAGHGLRVEGQRLYYTIVQLALRGLVAVASLKGKQPTFVWCDEWIPKNERRRLGGDEALCEVATRYIQSHGPVAPHDFSWWSGLTLTESRRAFSLVDSAVAVPDAPDYMMDSHLLRFLAQDAIEDSVFLAPAFDESVVGLKERSAVISSGDFKKMTPYSNGMFSPIILCNGQFAGLWSKKQTVAGIAIRCDVTQRLTPRQKELLLHEATTYAEFLGGALASLDIVALR